MKLHSTSDSLHGGPTVDPHTSNGGFADAVVRFDDTSIDAVVVGGAGDLETGLPVFKDRIEIGGAGDAAS